VQAVITLAAQFGNDELKISMADLTMVILMVQFVAFCGALLFDWITRWIGGAKPAVILSLVIWTGVLVAMYVSVRTKNQFFVAAAVVAIVLGGHAGPQPVAVLANDSQRPGSGVLRRNEISDKGTSWMCPLLFGLALQFTGSYRLAILSLVTFFIAGLLVLLTVDVRRRRSRGRNPCRRRWNHLM